MTDTTLEQARAIATELDDFKAPIYLRARCTLRNLADQVDRLTAERDALCADAARLDWLEASTEHHAFCHTEYGDYRYYAHQQEGYLSVRKTIDAAVAKEKP